MLCELCEFVVWFWCWVGFCCFVVAGLWFCLGWCGVGLRKGFEREARPGQASVGVASLRRASERASEQELSSVSCAKA